jgi:hypothetical protein
LVRHRVLTRAASTRLAERSVATGTACGGTSVSCQIWLTSDQFRFTERGLWKPRRRRLTNPPPDLEDRRAVTDA